MRAGSARLAIVLAVIVLAGMLAWILAGENPIIGQPF
jgi:hypothetical protein